MAPNFRATTTYPNADLESLIPGQLGFTIVNNPLHAADSPTNVPNPRGNPTPDQTPAPDANVISGRGFRAPTSGISAATEQEGLGLDPATGYRIGTTNSGALTGTPNQVADLDAHYGYDPLPGERTSERGVTNKDYGAWNSHVGGFMDIQAHELHADSDHLQDTRSQFNNGLTNSNYLPSEVVTNIKNAPENVNASDSTMLIRPEHYFTGGRPARALIPWLYERAFDQAISQNMSGHKAYPSSPPSIGGQTIEESPRASLPIRQDDQALQGIAYGGPAFGATGMNPSEQTRNTWRLQPQPWDADLITVGQ